jgi:hypothetical protein
VLPVLSEADMTVLNLEGNFYGAPYGADRSAPAELAQALDAAGVDIVQLANSYSIYKGMDGLARTINTLKGALPMEQVCNLLSYVNGRLDDESDDIIDDSDLYLYYIAAVCSIERPVADEEYVESHVERVVGNFAEPFPGAKKRIIKVLLVMINAYHAEILRKRAQDILATLD